MNAREFVDAIYGKEFRFTRTCLATGRVTDNTTVTPSEPSHSDTNTGSRVPRSSGILLDGCGIHFYDNLDLFTHDYGIYVAVVKSGAGHLWCDRFEPTNLLEF